MIIKSMPRKTSNFGQLYDYMLNNKHKVDRDYIFKNNLYLNIDTGLDREKIINEFKRNYEYTKERKNGNALYHEIISIKKNNDLTDKEQKEILFDIVKNYVDVRAKDCLSYGIMHEEKGNNLHYHLMISSNEIGESNKHRLSRNEFNTIQKNLEDYLISKHPQLKQEQVFNKTTNKQTKTRNEFEQEKRTGEKSKRSRVKEALEEVFKLSKTKEEFINNLQYTNLELYVRGQQIGFKDLKTNLKYRLNKIGLTKEFENLSKIIESQEKTQKAQTELKEQERIKQEKAQTELKEQERIKQEKFYQEEAQAIWEEQERIERIKEEAERQTEREINAEREREKAEKMYKEAQSMWKEQANIKEEQERKKEQEKEKEKVKQGKNSFFSKIGVGIEKTLGFIAGGDIYGRDRNPKEIYKKEQKEKKEREYKEQQDKKEKELKEFRKREKEREQSIKKEHKIKRWLNIFELYDLFDK